MRSKILFFLPLVFFLLSISGLEFLNLASGYSTGKAVSAAALKEDSTPETPVRSEPAETVQTAAPDSEPEKIPETALSSVGGEEKEKEGSLVITAVGDIMLGRSVATRLEKKPQRYIYAFEQVAEILKQGDIVFGNLEAPVTDSTNGLTGVRQGGKIVLRNKVEALTAIQFAGFTLLSLANNHILDYYDKGLFDTFELLKKNNIGFSGSGRNLEEARKPAVIEKKGKKIGLLSYTDMSELWYKGNPNIRFAAEKEKAGVAPRKLEYIKEDIERIRQSVDILIVSLHWGVEESFDIPGSQVEFAHEVLDFGADMILGHHPHQFQGIEIYKGKPIFYSLGNFIFDQNDPENLESFITIIKFSGNRPMHVSAVPVRIFDKCYVAPLKGKDAEGLLRREAELCGKLGTGYEIKENQLVFDLK